MSVAPFRVDSDAVMLAYYASAELGCFLSLGWPFPVNVLDLFTEFRSVTNGRDTPCGAGLLGALTYYGIDGIDSVEKSDMRELAMRGGSYTADEQLALLDYCQTDVDALAKLLPAMQPKLDLPRALLRGRYMAAVARMEQTGIPIDVRSLEALRTHWADIKGRLVEGIDPDGGIYTGRVFKAAKFGVWLGKRDIPWPQLPTGALDLRDETFRERARAYPAVEPIRELRSTLSQMRLADLAVGTDGRNRCMLSAFRAKTGRNQPSSAKFVFGPSKWLRSLIKPAPGYGLAYVDWSQQEHGIAAALSGDVAMKSAYESGDPYLQFAIQAGAAPQDATRHTHGPTRERFKACVLAVQYGMGPKSLAARIGQSEASARELLRKHRETYRTFWEWSDAAVDCAMLKGSIHTAFGWTLRVGPRPNTRSLRNFPMQANGAEMLRLACVAATERGIRVCAPIHDALLVEAPLEDLDDVVRATQAVMAWASERVLDGFRLRSDATCVRYPDRYIDPRGEQMWAVVKGIVDDLGTADLRTSAHPTCAPIPPLPAHQCAPVLSYISSLSLIENSTNVPRPGSVETTERRPDGDDPTTETTQAQEGPEVLEGSGTVGLVSGGCPTTRQDNPPSDRFMVQGRPESEPGSSAITVRPGLVGRVAGLCESCFAFPGNGDPCQCGTASGALSYRDIAGWPDGMTDPDAWERLTERAAIMEFDGGLARDAAEVCALAELLHPPTASDAANKENDDETWNSEQRRKDAITTSV